MSANGVVCGECSDCGLSVACLHFMRVAQTAHVRTLSGMAYWLAHQAFARSHSVFSLRYGLLVDGYRVDVRVSRQTLAGTYRFLLDARGYDLIALFAVAEHCVVPFLVPGARFRSRAVVITSQPHVYVGWLSAYRQRLCELSVAGAFSAGGAFAHGSPSSYNR